MEGYLRRCSAVPDAIAMAKSPEACPGSMTFGGGGSDFVGVVCDELEELELSEEVAERAGRSRSSC